MMARVKNKDSRAEIDLRRHLHKLGVRYRLHAHDVAGRPDIANRRWRLAVFVDGDFWHGNSWRLRGLNRLEDQFPNRAEFWTKKIRRNIERDREVTAALEQAGWRVVRIWESDVLADPERWAKYVLDALNEQRHG